MNRTVWVGSCREAIPWPHGLVAPSLHRPPAPSTRFADRGVGRGVDGRRGGPTARAARPQQAACGRCGTESPVGVHRPGRRHAGRPEVPLLAARGFAVPGQGDLRLRTLADVFAYAAAEDVELRLDGTEVRVRRPGANEPGRRVFVSGKMRQNTKKATVVTDGQGRTLWAGAFRPGRMHDQTAVKTEGICGLFEQYPQVRAKVDAGYRGLAQQFPDQVQAPPLKLKKGAPPEDIAAWDAARHQQSSERICVEHANAEHKQWRTLQANTPRPHSYTRP
ncbi:transposase family protein [Streptomyces sp. S6]